jgi:hypothetical protein
LVELKHAPPQQIVRWIGACQTAANKTPVLCLFSSLLSGSASTADIVGSDLLASSDIAYGVENKTLDTRVV